MPETTKSVSEFLRMLKADLESKVSVNFSLFNKPDSTAFAVVSVGEVGTVNKTGDCFKVKLNLLCECAVSISEIDCEFTCLEISLAIQEALDSNAFKCTAMPPENISNAPMGEDDRFTYRGLTWDQEVYIDKFIIEKG